MFILLILLRFVIHTNSNNFINGLIIEEPYYDLYFRIYRCKNDSKLDNPFKTLYENVEKINYIELMGQSEIQDAININKFTSGWNNSVYLGEFDTNYDHIIHRLMDFSIDYAFFEINFNILLIEPTINFTLNESNFNPGKF
jgi:hypothetical protein